MAVASYKPRKKGPAVRRLPLTYLDGEPYISLMLPKKTPVRLIQADSLLAARRNTVLASLFSNIGLAFLSTYFAIGDSVFLLISLPSLGAAIGLIVDAIRQRRVSREETIEYVIPLSTLSLLLKDPNSGDTQLTLHSQKN